MQIVIDCLVLPRFTVDAYLLNSHYPLKLFFYELVSNEITSLFKSN